MTFMYRIVEYLEDIADFFYYLYLECYSAFYIPDMIGDFFYEIWLIFLKLASRFYQFAEWVDDVAPRILDILSWDTIRSLILNWLPDLEMAVYWFLSRVSWFTNRVAIWWAETTTTVQGWIDIAVEGFNDLRVAWDNFWTVTFPEWTGKLDTLKVAWDNFWTVTFPSLISFSWLDTWWSDRLKELDKLINDIIVVWFPFYDDLVSLWEDIKLFFTDPLTWLESKFTDWFLGTE